jgi:hypothetical protein
VAAAALFGATVVMGTIAWRGGRSNIDANRRVATTQNRRLGQIAPRSEQATEQPEPESPESPLPRVPNNLPDEASSEPPPRSERDNVGVPQNPDPSSPANDPPTPAESAATAPWDLPREQTRIALDDRTEPDVGATVAVALRAARAEISGRNWGAARPYLSEATRRAVTVEEREAVERMNMLFALVDRFWIALESGLHGLRPGDTILYRDTEVAVESIADSQIILRAANGQQKSFVTNLTEIDGDLAAGVVQRELSAAGPVAFLVVGAFWAMDGHGDVATARQLWDQAEGQAVSVELLLPEIQPTGRKVVVPSDSSPQTAGAAESVARRDESANAKDKMPIPSDTLRKEAEKQIKELFERQYREAANRRGGGSGEFAKILLRQGMETVSDPVARYVLLDEARQMANRSAETDVAVLAIDELESDFAVDATGLRMELLVSLRAGRTREERRRVFDAAIALADQAFVRDDYDFAERCVKTAASVARGAGGASLLKYVQQRRSQVEYAKERFEQTREAAETLARQPDDPKANATIGIFLCFAKGDFSEGLPLLARGSNSALKELADKELSKPEDASLQMELADGWWEAADDEREPVVKMRLREHAGQWYVSARPNLQGLAKTEVEKRLSQLAPKDESDFVDERKLLFALMSRDVKIVWDKGDAWQQLRLYQDGRWGYKGKILGTWIPQRGTVVSTLNKNRQWHLVFSMEAGALNVVYYTSGKITNRGVVVSMDVTS